MNAFFEVEIFAKCYFWKLVDEFFDGKIETVNKTKNTKFTRLKSAKTNLIKAAEKFASAAVFLFHQIFHHVNAVIQSKE